MNHSAPDPIPNESPSASYANDLTQEVRLVVVMFGGVSLAIYMNGIAQELLKAVRATADEERGFEFQKS